MRRILRVIALNVWWGARALLAVLLVLLALLLAGIANGLVSAADRLLPARVVRRARWEREVARILRETAR